MQPPVSDLKWGGGNQFRSDLLIFFFFFSFSAVMWLFIPFPCFSQLVPFAGLTFHSGQKLWPLISTRLAWSLLDLALWLYYCLLYKYEMMIIYLKYKHVCKTMWNVMDEKEKTVSVGEKATKRYRYYLHLYYDNIQHDFIFVSLLNWRGVFVLLYCMEQKSFHF